MKLHLTGINCIVIALAAVLADELGGSESTSLPAEAKSLDEIIQAVDASKGFGTPASVHFRQAEREWFAVWYCPYSGRDATKLHVYEFEPQRKTWTRTIDHQFEHTHDLSLELRAGEGGFIVRDVRGKVIHRERASR